jgi:fido (protein-threonine AMPylation protein)
MRQGLFAKISIMVFSRAGALLLLVAADRSAALVPQSRVLGVCSLFREGGEEGVCFAEQEDSVWHDDFINVLRQKGSSTCSADISKLINDTLDRDQDGAINLDAMDRKRARISRLKNWVDSFRPLPPAVVESMKEYYDVFYTYNSNAIEGNTLSMSETQLVLEYGITVGGKTLIQHLEVVGHKEAIDYVEALSRKSTKITEFEIRNIHSLICRGTMHDDAGKYRSVEIRAGGTDYEYPSSFLVPQMMSDFVDWLNSSEADNRPADFASEAHFRFVTIHPFRDGNGRAARLLMNLLLLRAGFPIVVIVIDMRNNYIESLIAAQQKGDVDLVQLKDLIMEACETSLIDMLRFASTAGDSRGKGVTFYREVLNGPKS